jgi:type IV pilus assembly protein PilM
MDFKQEIKLSNLIPKGFAPKKKQPRVDERHHLMPKELVGLKIDSATLSAAQIVNNGDKRLVKLARAPLASGIVSAGEVRNPEALAGALNEFFAKNSLPRRGVRLGLGNSRILVRVTEIPAIADPSQLDNAIRFRAFEMISASPDEAVIDYRVVGSATDSEGNPVTRVLLVATYRDSIDRYLAATDAASLDLAGIDLEAFALLRAAREPAPPGHELETSALVAISVERERTTLAISDGEICHFARVLEWGEANIEGAVSQGLRIPPAEAATAWREAFSPASEDTPAEPSEPSPLAHIVSQQLQTLSREIQKSLRFYQSEQASPLQVDQVFFAGSLADVPGVVEKLQGDLRFGLTVIDPFARLRLDPGTPRLEPASDLSVAIGLGIED